MGNRRRPLLSAIAVGCGMLIASSSWAAVVEPGFGNLTINQGRGFLPVSGTTKVNVGDAVMVGPGGAATVVYDDGCRVEVRPGAVRIIERVSPCVLCPPDRQSQDNTTQYWPYCGPAWWEYGLAAALAGAGLGIAIYEATKSNGTTQPASP